MKEKLVLIGNGMAGARTIEELLALAPDKYDITVLGAEPYGNYNRILLSSVLTGEKTIEEIMINDVQWYADKGITLHTGKEVTKNDLHERQVIASDGTRENYDRLVLATGSDPVVIPLPGKDLEGVITFRTIRDVHAMMDTAEAKRRHAVVIGGGLLGLEAAHGLMKRGMEVTVVHIEDILMERQLDALAARLLKKSLEDRGLQFLMSVQTAAICGKQRVNSVRFTNGQEIPADLVVMATGIRPNLALAKSAGLQCERGVLVNDTLQTFDPRIYAVGECVQHRGMTYGLVAPLWEQAKVCANHLAAIGISRYLGSVVFTKLKVTGIDLFSAGDFNGDKTTDEIVLRDPSYGIYKKLIIKQNRLKGAVLYGDTADGAWYFQLIRETTDISRIREEMIFGPPKLDDVNHGDSIEITRKDWAEGRPGP